MHVYTWLAHLDIRIEQNTPIFNKTLKKCAKGDIINTLWKIVTFVFVFERWADRKADTWSPFSCLSVGSKQSLCLSCGDTREKLGHIKKFSALYPHLQIAYDVQYLQQGEQGEVANRPNIV